MKHIAPLSVALAAVIAGAALTLRRNPDAHLAEYRPPGLPSRTSVAPPAIAEPPSLPEGAAAQTPMSFTVTTTWADPHRRRQTTQHVTRTVDRAHLRLAGTAKEWLFEQNPVDRRRVSGYLVDHQSKQILTYQESDLRNEQQLRGWADVLLMRFDLAALARLRRTHEREVLFGNTFTRYIAQDQSKEGVIEVWWSDAVLLPVRLKVRQRGVLISSVINQLRPAETLTALADPRTVFDQYQVLDVTDSRERRH
jgi:hypothetical protein